MHNDKIKKFLKTLGIFIVNKFLELWHNIIAIFLMVAVCLVVIVGIMDLIGFIVIGILEFVGLHSITYELFITAYSPTAPFYMRGIVSGFIVCAVVILVVQIYEMNPIKFIKSNWEMAKKGEFYKHR